MIETQNERLTALPETKLDAIASDHVVLRDHGDRLETALDGMAGHPSGGHAAVGEQEVHAQLYEYRQLFCDHLANEEQEGLLELAITEAPHLARRVERLLADHERLRNRMETLLASAAVSSWVHIHVAFIAFRDELRQHERAEDDLMQHAYLDDLGGRG